MGVRAGAVELQKGGHDGRGHHKGKRHVHGQVALKEVGAGAHEPKEVELGVDGFDAALEVADALFVLRVVLDSIPNNMTIAQLGYYVQQKIDAAPPDLDKQLLQSYKDQIRHYEGGKRRARRTRRYIKTSSIRRVMPL